jgi:hypothetical protein
MKEYKKYFAEMLYKSFVCQNDVAFQNHLYNILANIILHIIIFVVIVCVFC